MIKLDKLIPLEKAPTVDVTKCNILDNWYDNEKGLRTRILEKDGRYFLHRAYDSGEASCIEVAVDWRVRADRIIFAWTPDDRHIYRVDSGGGRPVYEILRLELDQIQPGDSCTYQGMNLTYVDPSHVRMNNTIVPVKEDSAWAWAARKKWIRAQNGAAGFFRNLENIAEEYRAFRILPVHFGLWEKFFDFYNARIKEVVA